MAESLASLRARRSGVLVAHRASLRAHERRARQNRSPSNDREGKPTNWSSESHSRERLAIITYH